jgi:hypothetical protein
MMGDHSPVRGEASHMLFRYTKLLLEHRCTADDDCLRSIYVVIIATVYT